MKSLYRHNKGIGLVEILITMGVLAVGILGVAGLNSVISRQSQDNKAHAEALAIAQTRIEAIRNYTNDANTLAEFFNTVYPSTVNFQNAVSVPGVNAAFTRSERITDSGNNKIVDVIVSWTDADGDPQNVTLNTELAYISPRSVGDTALVASPDIVDAPTGRARLGEGTLDGSEELEESFLAEDGTTETFRDGEDLKLAVGDQVVLTLALACQTDDGTCSEFVKIKGRVYIDTASTTRQPHEIFLIASDAAFCARHYTLSDGTVAAFTSTTSSADTPNTAGGDYEYFDYTCYLGGGWHGNVGVVLAGGIAQRDKVCIGDPVTTVTADKPIIAVRRAYRGMIYKPSELANVNDLPWKFYSQGIADGVQLPYQSGHGHDFVVGEMAPANNAGTDCYPTSGASLLTRADSYVSGVKGALFEGMPPSFVCLNEFPDYLDTYSNEYTHVDSCPFDPTNPPSTRFIIDGSITFTGTQDSANDAFSSSIDVMTSDGYGNCLVTPFTYSATSYTATYQCDVYDWDNDLTNGWTGYIKPTHSTGMTCTPDPLNMTDISNNSSGNDFACIVGGPATWTGTVSQVGNGPSADKIIGSITVTGTGASAGVNGSCVIATNGFSYTCSTNPFLGTWSGDLVFTSGGAGGAICPYVPAAPTTKTYSLSGISSGTQTPIDLTIGRGSNGNGCP